MAYPPLADLIEQARREGKWLHCGYQDLWWSPDQLALENDQGRFRWGAENFTLRDPKERLAQYDRQIEALQREKENFISRMGERKD